jgi:DNA polymerase
MNDPATLAELREELADIAASARALLAWHEGTGGWGLPVETSAAEVLASLSPSAAPGRGAPPPAQVRRFPAPEASAAAPFRAPDPAGPPARPFAAPAPAAVPVVAAASAPEPARHEPPPRHVTPAPPAVERPAARPAAPARVLGVDERRTRLDLLAEEVRDCNRCRLCQARTQTVFARGNPAAELCFIGEGPGAEEDAQGEPFVGPAGQLLDRMIAAMGYHRDEVYICNIVKCRPPDNRKPEPDEMAACRPYLTAQLELVAPKYIVALGSTATQGLFQTTEGITRLRGKWKLYKGIPVMPTFHPAYLLRQPSAKREVWSDLQQVMQRLGKQPSGKR